MRAAAPVPRPQSVRLGEGRDGVPQAAPPLAARVLVVLTLGACLGLAGTQLLIDRGVEIGVAHAGIWAYRPQVGTRQIDPYAKAIFAREGQSPMPAGEGLLFEARTDAGGRPLDRTCSYLVTGPVPVSRVWTLTVQAPTGTVLPNEAQRFGFDSSEILRRSDGRFSIELASEARPGNWLPLSGTGEFVVALRLYETPLAATRIEPSGAAFPSITRQGCSGS